MYVGILRSCSACSPYLSATHSTHRPRTYPIQLSFRQRDSDMRAGSIRPLEGKANTGKHKVIHAARHVLCRCSLQCYRPTTLRICACDRWRKSRMLVGYRAWRVFFVTIVIFFVSTVVFLQKYRGKKGDRHGSGDMRGRAWICAVIDERIGFWG